MKLVFPLSPTLTKLFSSSLPTPNPNYNQSVKLSTPTPTTPNQRTMSGQKQWHLSQGYDLQDQGNFRP